MIFEKLFITKQNFKAKTKTDTDIDVLLMNIEALSCIGQVSKLLLDHKSQRMYVFNYNSTLFDLFGSESRSLDSSAFSVLETKEHNTILTKYFELINNYFIEKSKDQDKTVYFMIDCQIGRAHV